MTHDLKTWPIYFQAILDHAKTFEIRKNDRDFKVGDILMLREYEPVSEQYTGREVCKVVTDVFSHIGFGLQSGYVILSLKEKMEASFEIYTDIMLRRNPHLDPDKLFTKTRKREYVIVRQVLGTLMKISTKKSLHVIGALMHQDHASTLHGIRKVADLYDTDKTFMRSFDQILESCGIPVETYIKFKEKPVREYLPI